VTGKVRRFKADVLPLCYATNEIEENTLAQRLKWCPENIADI